MKLIHHILVDVPIEQIFDFARLMKEKGLDFEDVYTSSKGFATHIEDLENELR